MIIKEKLQQFYSDTRKKITQDELMSLLDTYDYPAYYDKVSDLVNSGLLDPVKRAKPNGRFPSLPKRFHILVKQYGSISNDELQLEVRLLHPDFAHQHYLNNLPTYKNHREIVQILNDFFVNQVDKLSIPASINERSLQIFGKEKFIKDNYSRLKRVLEYNGLGLGYLNFYETPEPFTEYVCNYNPDGMKILIVENKDTWYTMHRIMKNKQKHILAGIPLDSVVYGQGKRITRSTGRLEDYFISQGVNIANSNFYYFGDLDYVGLWMFKKIVHLYPSMKISPFGQLYEDMLRLANLDKLQTTKKRQLKYRGNDFSIFFRYFNDDIKTPMLSILEKGLYIPQETLNYEYFVSAMKGV